MATAVTGAMTAVAPPAFAIGFGQVTGAQASDIGAGGGAVWITDFNVPVRDNQGHPVGEAVERWNGSGWDQIFQPGHVPAAGGSIAVDPEGNAWLVNDLGNVFHYDPTQGHFVGVQAPPGGATDIGVGTDANETIWATGKNLTAVKDNQGNSVGGFVWRRNGSGGWDKIIQPGGVPAGGEQLDVDPNGRAWIANNLGNIFRYTPNQGFVPVNAPLNTDPAGPNMQAFDIGIGAQGDLWITSTTRPGPGGFEVLGWTGSNWAQVPPAPAGTPPSAITITSGSSKDPWVATSNGNIYHCSPNCH